MKKTILLTCFTSLILGCADISTQFVKMQEAETGDRARLRITANMLVKGVPNSDCTDWSRPGAGTVFGGIVGSRGYRGRSVNMPNPENIAPEDSGELYIAANKPIALLLINTPESPFLCSIAGYFTPEANKDYQIDVKTGPYGVNQSICTMLLREITADGQLVPLPIQEVSCHRKEKS